MLPKFAVIQQQLSNQAVDDIPAAVRKELSAVNLQNKIKPGMRIAVTAGSRGIYQIPVILKTICDVVRSLGGEPFLLPAMGSHGGATAPGQVHLLQELGITEQSVGAPIMATMDVVQLGTTDSGIPVYLDAYAAAADGIIVAARVKPHTDFRNPIESGLHKMIAIGLGKHKQALAIHRYGIRGLKEYVPQVAQLALTKAPILCALAILENGYDRTAKIEAVLPEMLADREPELLAEARSLMPRLCADQFDVLVVGEIGKNYSGTGMDTNIIGRVRIAGEPEFPSPKIRYIVVLGLSEAARGNALGIGLADLTTEKVMHEIDYAAMRENVITSTFIERGKIPMALPDDRSAIEAAQRCLWLEDPAAVRMMYINNTLEVSRIAVSETILAEIQNKPGIEVLSPLQELNFDQQGRLQAPC
jgi:hypothetical protein